MSDGEQVTGQNPHPCSSAAPTRSTREVADISNVPYGLSNVSMEPSRDDIQSAIDSEQLEERGFQSHKTELNDEWNKAAKDWDDYCRLQKQYHARRIAYFVVNPWSHPIKLDCDGKIIDGLHRFKAAVFKGMTAVEVCVEQTPPSASITE